MTKKQYLKKLERCIQALPQEEQKEALEYYSDYFDDADDDEKVIEELGEPEELAKSIIEKFSCVPAKTNRKAESKKEDDEEETSSKENEVFEDDEKLYFSFPKDMVVNLGISLGAGDIVIKTGSEYKVETRGIASENFNCKINDAGTLIIENVKFSAKAKNWGIFGKRKWCPRILITVPEKVELENFKIILGAGQIRTKELNITSNKTMIDVTAGNFEFDGITSNATFVKCAMGNVDLYGTFKGFTKIDCSMGAVRVRIPEGQKNYSCDGKVGMGTVIFGNDKRNGFSQSITSERKKNHFAVNVGMGEIRIKFDE